MKDYNGKLQYKNREYKLVFNLNVMEKVQEEYGTLDYWGSLTDGSAYGQRAYEKFGLKKPWDDLTAKEKEKYGGEPDAKAVIFGFTEMINEGIDIENEENGTNLPFMTQKQVGRMITDIGISSATEKLNQTVIDSTKNDDEKNE